MARSSGLLTTLLKLLTAILASLAAAGIVALLTRADFGTAPANGERVFDTPGCPPNAYDGPNPAAVDRPESTCPPPRPRILVHVTRIHGGWYVVFDGRPSYDPEGGRITRYEWVGPRSKLGFGPILRIVYREPGSHSAVLRLQDDRGVGWAGRATVDLR